MAGFDPITQTQECSTCLERKPLAAFSFNRNMPTGHHTVCKPCASAYAKTYRKRPGKRERQRELQAGYRADDPEAYRINSREKARRLRADPEYLARERANRDLNRALNLAAHRAKDREYAALRRARKRGATGRYTKTDIDRIYKAQRGRCAGPGCGKPLRGHYHRDHIVAIVNGGTNAPSNIQLLCPRCNSQKKDKDPITFNQEKGLLI